MVYTKFRKDFMKNFQPQAASAGTFKSKLILPLFNCGFNPSLIGKYQLRLKDRFSVFVAAWVSFLELGWRCRPIFDCVRLLSISLFFLF